MPPSARDIEQYGKIADELQAIAEALRGLRAQDGGGGQGDDHEILEDIADDLADVRSAVVSAGRPGGDARSAARTIAHEFREISRNLERYGESEKA
jgi:hypothetical protein